MHFRQYTFRASQAYKLAVGTIRVTDLQRARIDELEARKTTLQELTDKQKEYKKSLLEKESLTKKQEDDLADLLKKEKTPIGLTPTMKTELAELLTAMESKELPKTMQTELRKIFRSEKFKRNFVFTNKFIQKGLQEEEEAISTYQKYLKEIGRNVFLLKNKERFYGDYFQGEPDLFDSIDPKLRTEGFDIKCSWNLDTFPFKEDDLDDQYEWQNQVYMHLTGLKKWTTAHVLVNVSEDGLYKEKLKWYYALKKGNTFPDDQDSPYFEEYQKRCHEIERMLIFDYDRFIDINPYHQMTIGRDEWFGEGYDIPIVERVVEKVSEYSPEKLEYLTERAILGREYMNKLNTL